MRDLRSVHDKNSPLQQTLFTFPLSLCLFLHLVMDTSLTGSFTLLDTCSSTTSYLSAYILHPTGWGMMGSQLVQLPFLLIGIAFYMCISCT